MKFDPKDFPEGKRILERLKSETTDKIKPIEKIIFEVYNNPDYDDTTKAFIVQVISTLYLLPLVEQRKSYTRNLAMYQENKSQFTLNIDKAKQVPIEELFSHVKARKTSTRITCQCPFHDEKNPSFVIYRKSNTYHCFSCHSGGDSITFVMKLHNKTFKEAVLYLEKL